MNWPATNDTVAQPGPRQSPVAAPARARGERVQRSTASDASGVDLIMQWDIEAVCLNAIGSELEKNPSLSELAVLHYKVDRLLRMFDPSSSIFWTKDLQLMARAWNSRLSTYKNKIEEATEAKNFEAGSNDSESEFVEVSHP